MRKHTLGILGSQALSGRFLALSEGVGSYKFPGWGRNELQTLSQQLLNNLTPGASSAKSFSLSATSTGFFETSVKSKVEGSVLLSWFNWQLLSLAPFLRCFAIRSDLYWFAPVALAKGESFLIPCCYAAFFVMRLWPRKHIWPPSSGQLFWNSSSLDSWTRSVRLVPVTRKPTVCIHNEYEYCDCGVQYHAYLLYIYYRQLCKNTIRMCMDMYICIYISTYMWLNWIQKVKILQNCLTWAIWHSYSFWIFWRQGRVKTFARGWFDWLIDSNDSVQP